MPTSSTPSAHGWGLAGLVGLGVLLGLVGGPAPLAAQAGGRAGVRPGVVVVADPSWAPDARALVRVLRSRLGSADLSVRLIHGGGTASTPTSRLIRARRIARTQQGLVVIWRSGDRASGARLLFTPRGAARGVLRSVARGKSTAAGHRELIATIVLTGLEALPRSAVAGASPRTASAAPPPTPGAPSTAPAPVRRASPATVRPRRAAPRRATPRPAITRPAPAPGTSVRKRHRPSRRLLMGELSAQYSLAGFSSQDSQPMSHTGELELHLRIRRRWHALMGYAFTTLSANAEGAGVTLERHTLRLGGGYGWRWGRLRLALQLSAAVDLLDRRSAVDSGEPLAAEAPGLDVNVALEATARITWFLTRRVGIHTGVGARFMLQRSDYWVEEVPILQPWPVQPLWSIGLTIRLF